MTNNPAQLRSAATALLSAAEMLEHNEAIFKGKWKKGSKAWSGDFIERTVQDGLGLIGAGRVVRSESKRLTPEQKAAWQALDKDAKDGISGAFLAFAAMMDKDYGISKAQAVKMMDIAYDVNGATK